MTNTRKNATIINPELLALHGEKSDLAWTPLHDAAFRNATAEIQQLVDQGHDIDDRDNFWGVTPLFIASLHGHRETALALLENGANPDLRDNTGHNAAEAALLNDDVIRGPNWIDRKSHAQACDMLDLILDNGSDPEQINSNGESLLWTAIRNRDDNTVIHLITTRGLDPTLRNHDGLSAHSAVVDIFCRARALADMGKHDGIGFADDWLNTDIAAEHERGKALLAATMMCGVPTPGNHEDERAYCYDPAILVQIQSQIQQIAGEHGDEWRGDDEMDGKTRESLSTARQAALLAARNTGTRASMK